MPANAHPTADPALVVEAGFADPAALAVAAAWQAAEWLVASDSGLREKGFTLLTRSETTRLSPLVCYLLVHLLDDPDRQLRAASVHRLAQIFVRQNNRFLVPAKTRQYVSALLRRFSAQQVVHMLEVLDASAFGDLRADAAALARLLDRTPDIAAHLTHIAAGRGRSPEVRIAAVRMIRELGLLEALPVLQGLRSRIVGRQAGQLAMRFAPPADPQGRTLLAALDEAIAWLEEAI